MDFLLILFGVLFAYWLVVLIYHVVSKIAYVKEVYVRSSYRNIFLGCALAGVGIFAGVYAFNTHYYSPWFGKWVSLVAPLGILILVFIAIDMAVKKHNWKKYTLSKFVEGAVYDLNVCDVNEDMAFGWIYWDQKKGERRSWAYLELDDTIAQAPQVGKTCKIKFCSDYCFPNRNGFCGNLVMQVEDLTGLNKVKN